MKYTTGYKIRRLWRKIKKSIISLPIIFILLYLGYNFIYKPVIIESDNNQEINDNIAGQIKDKITYGEYDKAIEELNSKISEYPDDNSLKTLYSQVMDELSLDFKFNYLPGQRRGISMSDISTDLTLTKNDPYYLSFHPAEKCFVYIIQFTSSGDIIELFPNPKYSYEKNPVPGIPTRIPKDFGWFYLDNVPGIEIIYLIASRWEQKELESLFANLNNEKDIEKISKLKEEILNRIQKEEQATDKVPGLVFGKYQFNHNSNNEVNLNGRYTGTIKDSTFWVTFIDDFNGVTFSGYNIIYWEEGKEGLKASFKGTFNNSTGEIEMLEDRNVYNAGKFIGQVTDNGSSIEGTWTRYSDGGAYPWNLRKSK